MKYAENSEKIYYNKLDKFAKEEYKIAKIYQQDNYQGEGKM